ncbi:uncharacterized protein TNCV_2840811 [Trichonephila clavipes]|uniref:Uncharacterized protein n=1 Tax=Trichonephila clavipes TaxID=2585209 RepID=A0A8X6RU24_TRICX|nr:uncharacterized protein TNCV_2840811 [Trichonephila clavipes]
MSFDPSDFIALTPSTVSKIMRRSHTLLNKKQRKKMPLWHGATLNRRRTTSPRVRLVEGEKRWEASDHPQGVLLQNWGGTEPNRTVTCMVLKATANNRHITRLSIG